MAREYGQGRPNEKLPLDIVIAPGVRPIERRTGSAGNSDTTGGSYQDPRQFGNYYLWVDTTGDLRIKSSLPTIDLDGTVVGTQS
jgi:hypothetical protein